MGCLGILVVGLCVCYGWCGWCLGGLDCRWCLEFVLGLILWFCCCSACGVGMVGFRVCGVCSVILSFCCFGVSGLGFVSVVVVLGFNGLVLVVDELFSFVFAGFGWDLVWML